MKSFIVTFLGLLFSCLSLWAQDSSSLTVQGKEIILSSQFGEVQIDTLYMTVPAQSFLQGLLNDSEQISTQPPQEKTGEQSIGEILFMIFLYLVEIVAGIIAACFAIMVLYAVLRKKNEEANKYIRWMWVSVFIMASAMVLVIVSWGNFRQELSIGIIGSVFGSALYGYFRSLFNRGGKGEVKEP